MNSRQWTALLIVSLIWGSSFLFLRVLLTAGMGPAGVSCARTTLGALILLPIALVTRPPWPRDRRTWLMLVALGAGNFALPWTLFGFGQEHVPSGIGSVANSSMPLWAVIAATVVVRSETLSRQRLVGLLVGFAGVAILFAGSFANLGRDALFGLPPMLLATMCYGLSSVSIRRWLTHVHPLPLTITQLGFAAIMLWPVALGTHAYRSVDMGWHEWTSMLTLGIVGSGLTVVVYMWLVQQVGGVRASISTYLMPPTGVFLGWLLLDEPIGWNLAAGLAVIVCGVALVQGLRPRIIVAFVRRPARPAPPAAIAIASEE